MGYLFAAELIEIWADDIPDGDQKIDFHDALLIGCDHHGNVALIDSDLRDIHRVESTFGTETMSQAAFARKTFDYPDNTCRNSRETALRAETPLQHYKLLGFKPRRF